MGKEQALYLELQLLEEVGGAGGGLLSSLGGLLGFQVLVAVVQIESEFTHPANLVHKNSPLLQDLANVVLHGLPLFLFCQRLVLQGDGQLLADVQQVTVVAREKITQEMNSQACGSRLPGGHDVVVVDELHERLDLHAVFPSLGAHVAGDAARVAVDASD